MALKRKRRGLLHICGMPMRMRGLAGFYRITLNRVVPPPVRVCDIRYARCAGLGRGGWEREYVRMKKCHSVKTSRLALIIRPHVRAPHLLA